MSLGDRRAVGTVTGGPLAQCQGFTLGWDLGGTWPVRGLCVVCTPPSTAGSGAGDQRESPRGRHGCCESQGPPRSMGRETDPIPLGEWHSSRRRGAGGVWTFGERGSCPRSLRWLKGLAWGAAHARGRASLQVPVPGAEASCPLQMPRLSTARACTQCQGSSVRSL